MQGGFPFRHEDPCEMSLWIKTWKKQGQKQSGHSEAGCNSVKLCMQWARVGVGWVCPNNKKSLVRGGWTWRRGADPICPWFPFQPDKPKLISLSECVCLYVSACAHLCTASLKMAYVSYLPCKNSILLFYKITLSKLNGIVFKAEITENRDCSWQGIILHNIFFFFAWLLIRQLVEWKPITGPFVMLSPSFLYTHPSFSSLFVIPGPPSSWLPFWYAQPLTEMFALVQVFVMSLQLPVDLSPCLVNTILPTHYSFFF